MEVKEIVDRCHRDVMHKVMHGAGDRSRLAEKHNARPKRQVSRQVCCRGGFKCTVLEAYSHSSESFSLLSSFAALLSPAFVQLAAARAAAREQGRQTQQCPRYNPFPFEFFPGFFPPGFPPPPGLFGPGLFGFGFGAPGRGEDLRGGGGDWRRGGVL